MRKLLVLIITILTVAYPLLVYIGVQHISPAIFGFLFLAAGVIRFAIAKDKSDPLTVAVLVLIGMYSLTLAVSGNALLLRFYPVVVSFGMAGVFAFSLRREVSLIESFAIAAGKTITPNAKHYTRQLTAIWAVLLVVNGCVALYLSLFASLAAWALYCGLLSYCVMGLFFLGEWLYRQHYIRRVGQ